MINDANDNLQDSVEDFNAAAAETRPFWQEKSLRQLNCAEWEALCDGCGRCCLNKLEDWDSGEIVWTDIACQLLDARSCQCQDYAKRQARVPDCIQITPAMLTGPDAKLSWLPASCAYARRAQGLPLLWWHPLVSRDPNTVHAAGISVRGRVRPEADIPVADYTLYIVDWPNSEPDDSQPDLGGHS